MRSRRNWHQSWIEQRHLNKRDSMGRTAQCTCSKYSANVSALHSELSTRLSESLSALLFADIFFSTYELLSNLDLQFWHLAKKHELRWLNFWFAASRIFQHHIRYLHGLHRVFQSAAMLFEKSMVYKHDIRVTGARHWTRDAKRRRWHVRESRWRHD